MSQHDSESHDRDPAGNADVPASAPPGDGHRLAEQAREQAKEDNDAAAGETSQVAKMDPADADTPISDSQSVAGQPNADGGPVQEGKQGPNANPHEDLPTH